jgi:CP family cyanate transporter-like MFS transporter
VYSAQWMSVIGFLPSIYSQAGLPAGWTAVATAAAAAVNIIGNVASGRLLQRGQRPDRLLLAGYAAMGLGAWIAFGPVVQGLPASAAAALRYVAVLVFSMVGGMIPGTLFSLAVRLAPDQRTVSTTVGWMQQWSCLGQFVGPPLVAWVAHRAGGWQWTWLVTGGCALLGIALALGSRRRLRAATVSA